MATVLACAGFVVLMAVLMLVVAPHPVAGGVASARQGAETTLYLAAFGVLLPLALYGAPKLTRAIATGPNAEALPSLVAVVVSAFAVAVIVVRLTGVFASGGGFGALLIGTLGWWAVAAAALARAARRPAWPMLLRITEAAPWLWSMAGTLVFGALLTVVHIASVSVLPIAVGAMGVALVLNLFVSGRAPLRLGRRWGLVADGLLAALLVLAIPDLVIMRPEDLGLDFAERFANLTVQFHQDFLVGPANQVLGGDAMLVDTSSQYGVGSILFIAGWFKLLPIGYGTFGLLDGVLTALFFLAGFLLLRVCKVSRLLSASALAVGVIALVYNREYPVGSIVQEGPIRFGFPLAVVLGVVAAARWPRHRRILRGGAFVLLGLSSIWAMEMFAYTAATFAVILGMEAYLLPRRRVRWLVRQLALGAAACVGAHLLFAAGTLVATGELPAWSQYLVYLKAFVLGDVGDITYDFSRWSPGLAVGAGYLTSALTLGLALRMQPRIFEGERAALLALTGTTAYGIFSLSYFVDRSAPHVLVYMCLPLLLAGVLWLSLLMRSEYGPKRPGATVGALAFVLCVAVLLITGAWSRIGPRFENSALAYAMPGTKPARAAYARLKDFPRFDPRSLEGEQVLERHMPGERRSLVLVKPSLDTEILMHSGRANALPLPNAIQYSFVGASKLPLLKEAVAALDPGRRMLLDREQLAALVKLKANLESVGPLTQVPPIGSPTTPLQVYTLAEIDKRFRLRPVYNRNGFLVVELVARP